MKPISVPTTRPKRKKERIGVEKELGSTLFPPEGLWPRIGTYRLGWEGRMDGWTGGWIGWWEGIIGVGVLSGLLSLLLAR